MRFEAGWRTRRRVGLTPLVDVVFLLLIFFMLASSLSRDDALAIDVVPRDAEPALAHESVSRLLLRADGSARLDGRPVEDRALRPALSALVAGDPSRRLLVLAEDPVPLQRIVSALEAAQLGGAADVALGRVP